jgi:carbon monoxide dehydrogenase subunit G
MSIEHTFDVPAPPEEVWRALTDLERVAPCLPGAAVSARDADGTVHGTLEVDLGTTTAAYEGSVALADVDATARTATLLAEGAEERSGGTARATIALRVGAADGASRVAAAIELAIDGAPEGRARGELLRDFATCVQSRVVAEQTPVAPSGAQVAAGEAPPEAVAAAAPETPRLDEEAAEGRPEDGVARD